MTQSTITVGSGVAERASVSVVVVSRVLRVAGGEPASLTEIRTCSTVVAPPGLARLASLVGGLVSPIIVPTVKSLARVARVAVVGGERIRSIISTIASCYVVTRDAGALGFIRVSDAAGRLSFSSRTEVVELVGPVIPAACAPRSSSALGGCGSSVSAPRAISFSRVMTASVVSIMLAAAVVVGVTITMTVVMTTSFVFLVVIVVG